MDAWDLNVKDKAGEHQNMREGNRENQRTGDKTDGKEVNNVCSDSMRSWSQKANKQECGRLTAAQAMQSRRRWVRGRRTRGRARAWGVGGLSVI